MVAKYDPQHKEQKVMERGLNHIMDMKVSETISEEGEDEGFEQGLTQDSPISSPRPLYFYWKDRKQMTNTPDATWRRAEKGRPH